MAVSKRRKFPSPPGSAILWMVAAAAFAQQPAPVSAIGTAAAGNPNDPFAMNLDSLFNTKVTTASKFTEKLSDFPGVEVWERKMIR